jgi:hypothetical protein
MLFRSEKAMSKIVKLPVDPYIFKFLQHKDIDLFLDNNYSFTNHKIYGRILHIVQRAIPAKRDSALRINKWLYSSGGNKIDILVNVDRPSKQRLYNISQHLIQLFKKELRRKMFDAQDRQETNSMECLKQFFEECDITEADFKVATAYKDFQRFKKKREQNQTEYKWKFKGNLAVITVP